MQAFDRIRRKCNQIVMKPRFHVPSMTQNRLPTSSIAIVANTSFHFHAADWYTRRRRSDEYDSGATPGRSTISQGEVIHMADKTQVQVREVKQLLRELLKISGMSETSIKLGITYIQGLSDGEATQTSTKV